VQTMRFRLYCAFFAAIMTVPLIQSAGAEDEPFDSWPAFQFDSARSGVSPTSTAPFPVATRWNRTYVVGGASGPASSESGVLGKDLFFFGGGDNTIHAIDAATSAETWDFYADSATGMSTPVYHRGIVYAASEHTLYALEASTGALLWSAGAACSGPQSLLVVNEKLYVAGCKGVQRLSLNDGATEWLAEPACSARCHAASNGSLVFVPTRVGVTAIDAQTGEVRWSLTSGPETRPVQFVTYREGSLYFGTSGSGVRTPEDIHFYLYRVNAESGAVIWKRDQGYLGSTASPVVSGDKLIVRVAAGGENFLEAFDVADGSVLWSAFLGNRAACPVCSSPIVVGETVWITTDGYGLGVTPYRVLYGSVLLGFNASDGSLFALAQPPGVVYGLSTPAFDGTNFYMGFESQLSGQLGGAWSAGDTGSNVRGVL
jgi:outer membrane protein assembly factor BamB